MTWACASCGTAYAEPPVQCAECGGVAFSPLDRENTGTDWLGVASRVLFALATLFWALGGSIFIYQRLIA